MLFTFKILLILESNVCQIFNTNTCVFLNDLYYMPSQFARLKPAVLSLNCF